MNEPELIAFARVYGAKTRPSIPSTRAPTNFVEEPAYTSLHFSFSKFNDGNRSERIKIPNETWFLQSSLRLVNILQDDIQHLGFQK